MLNHPILRLFLLSALLFVLLAILGHSPDVQRAFFSSTSDGVTIQDYFYYISIVNSWWAQPSNPYDPHFHMQFLSELAGHPIKNFMPLGLTPTFLVVLLPFGLVAKSSIFLSYCLWEAIALSAIFWVLHDAVAEIKIKKRQIYFLVLSIALLLSQAALNCLMLGQTSVYALAILLALALNQHATHKGSLQRAWVRGALLFLLTIKAHYLILGGSLFLLKRDYQALKFALIFVFAAAALTWGYSGQLLYAEYLSSLKYFAGASGHVQVDVVALTTSNTFRSAFAALLGIDLSSLISKLLLALCLMASLWGCLKSKKPGYVPFYLAGLGLLCFMPYVGGYDDLLCLALLLISDLGINPTRSAIKAREFGAALLLILVLNRALLWPIVSPLTIAIKISLFLVLLHLPQRLDAAR